MLVACASSCRKIPCRERHRIYVHDHLDCEVRRSDAFETEQAISSRVLTGIAVAKSLARFNVPQSGVMGQRFVPNSGTESDYFLRDAQDPKEHLGRIASHWECGRRPDGKE